MKTVHNKKHIERCPGTGSIVDCERISRTHVAAEENLKEIGAGLETSTKMLVWLARQFVTAAQTAACSSSKTAVVQELHDT